MERRRLETLRTTIRVSLQVTGVLIVLLVIFGVPNNFGTFLGLAGAGLTVALKDFIIGFFGWFMLMGRNGIRTGDLVEINGVTGEVVEPGFLHGAVGDRRLDRLQSPTGRRVTFTSSFAIEGHYFNFDLGAMAPGRDSHCVPRSRPYPIVDAIRQEVEEATADSGGRTRMKGASRSWEWADCRGTGSQHQTDRRRHRDHGPVHRARPERLSCDQRLSPRSICSATNACRAASDRRTRVVVAVQSSSTQPASVRCAADRRAARVVLDARVLVHAESACRAVTPIARGLLAVEQRAVPWADT